MDAEVTSGHAYGKAVDLWHLVRGPPLWPAALSAVQSGRIGCASGLPRDSGQLFILAIRTVAGCCAGRDSIHARYGPSSLS